MKKSLIALALIAIVGLLTLTACATAPMHAAVDEAEAVDTNAEANTDMGVIATLPEFLSFTGTIIEIRPFYDFTAAGEVVVEGKFFVLLEGEANADGYAPQTNFLVDQNTLLLAETELTIGQTVVGFYETGLPMAMIYPPQHMARVLAVKSAESGGVYVGRFDAGWLNADATLQISITNNTEIVFADGRPFDSDISELIGRALVVLHGDVDHLLPAQTTANKIVVLFERAVHPIHFLTEEELAEMALPENEGGFASIDTSWQGGFQLSQEDIDMMLDAMFDPETVQVIIDGEAVPMPTPFINREAGFAMVPVADIAEVLGYEVHIISDTEIMVGRSMITVGVDSYAMGRMAPLELGAAPELRDGVIFVPLHFFDHVLPFAAYIMGGNIFVSSNAYIGDIELVD